VRRGFKGCEKKQILTLGMGVWEKIIATSPPRPCPKVRLCFIPSKKSLKGIVLDGEMVGPGSLRPI
jgi:hypothetical protein